MISIVNEISSYFRRQDIRIFSFYVDQFENLKWRPYGHLRKCNIDFRVPGVMSIPKMD